MSEELGGWGGLEVVSLSLKGAPPPTPALPASPFGMKFCALFMTLLWELRFQENGTPGDGRTCDPLMPVHVLERPHFFKK